MSSSSECWAIVPYTGVDGDAYQEMEADDPNRWATVPYALDVEPISEVAPANTASNRKRGRPRSDPNHRPEWLPCGWDFKRAVRTTGKSKGHIDTIFYSPPPVKRQFRSQAEVMYYLKHGKRRPPNPKTRNPLPAAGANMEPGHQ